MHCFIWCYPHMAHSCKRDSAYRTTASVQLTSIRIRPRHNALVDLPPVLRTRWVIPPIDTGGRVRPSGCEKKLSLGHYRSDLPPESSLILM